MSNTTNPEQKYVPTDHHGRVLPGKMRHTFDCMHFYPKADPADHAAQLARLARDPEAKVSYVREATDAEMETIPPCTTCGWPNPTPTLVTTCPICHMERSASGACGC